MEEHGVTCEIKTHLDLDYADDLSILNENISKQNEPSEVLQVQYAKSLKINVKKTKSLRLGISEGKDVMLDNEKIHQVDSFNYLGSIINKDGGQNKAVKIRIDKGPGCFFQS